MDEEMCMERKNEMKKYIRKEAKKERLRETGGEWRRKFVYKERMR